MKKQKRVHIVSAVNAANVTKDGSKYTIRDVCGATDDIVMNQRLYPADQLAIGAPTLNGKPAPAGHPKNSFGQHISAANGEALATAWIGAYCTNVRHEGGRTLTDVVVNGDMARATPLGLTLVERLDAAIAGTNAEPIHVSTGLNLAEVVANGESRGKKYRCIATNIQYDHLAILLNETGAGTPEEGVGMFVNAQGEQEEIETVVVNAAPDDRRDEGLLKTLLRKLLGNSNELSFDQIYSGIQALLPESAWPREVFSNYFIWCDRDSKLFKQDYSISSDGSIAFVGQAVEVTRKVDYEPITNQKDDPVKEHILAALNAAGITTAGLDDSKLLSAYNALVIKPVEEKLIAANSKVAGFEAERTAALNAERDTLATELAVNSSLTVDDLKLFPVERLKELKAKAGATAAPVTVASNAATKPGDEFAGYDLNAI
ncbi:hypothetical protein NF681_11400 [Comamonadaceae bacterium OTU4NAUVB1]|nr:hypothetical protein NF681_11400 [Comamonadaceae bacterium OTU4NAUVB1]